MNDELYSLPVPTAAAVARLELRPLALLQEGWAFVKPHYAQVLLIALASVAASALLGRIRIVGGVLSLGVTTVCGSGGLYFLLQRYRGVPVGLGAVLEPIQRKPVELLVVYLLTSLIVGLGFVLLVIPGIIAAALLALAVPLTLLTRTGVVDAITRSVQLVRPRLGDWVVLVLGLMLANLLGALLCGLGLLISIPATAGALTLLTARLFGVSRPQLASGDAAAPWVTPA